MIKMDIHKWIYFCQKHFSSFNQPVNHAARIKGYQRQWRIYISFKNLSDEDITFDKMLHKYWTQTSIHAFIPLYTCLKKQQDFVQSHWIVWRSKCLWAEKETCAVSCYETCYPQINKVTEFNSSYDSIINSHIPTDTHKCIDIQSLRSLTLKQVKSTINHN